MKIDSYDLSRIVKKLKNNVPKDVGEIRHGILVKNGTFSATGFHMSARITSEYEGDDVFVIPRKAFEIIESLPGGKVEMTVDEHFGVTLKIGKIKNRFASIDPKLYTEFREISPENKISISTEKFNEAISSVLFAASRNPSQPMLGTVHMKADGQRIRFAATDGMRIAKYETDFEGEFETMIPQDTSRMLLALGMKGDVSIGVDKVGMYFQSGEYELYSNTVDGKYFDYDRLMTDMPVKIEADRKEFLESVRRAGLCADGEKVAVMMTVADKNVKITMRGRTSIYEEEIPFDGDVKEEMKIGFDCRYLSDSLNAVKGDVARVSLGGPKMPMVMYGDSDSLCVVTLPVNLPQT